MIVEVSSEFNKAEAKLAKRIEHFKTEIGLLRAGRANPSVLSKIVVDYYGAPTPLNQVANISVPEARLLVISPYDPSMIKVITKAILASDIGINPADDGKVVRLAFPQLNEERRRELAKQVKKLSEDTKVGMRNDRRDLNDALKRFKKDSVITEDDLVTYEKDSQKMLDKNIELLEKLQKEKENEILDVNN